VATTASNYYNKIDVTFPKAGQDNDSKPFRDNFNNIKQALESTDTIVNELRLSIVTTSTVNNFGFNTIKRANFQDCSVNIYDDTSNTRSQSVAINYSNGSYQKFKIDKDTTTFNVINWPSRTDNTTGLGGNVELSIAPASSAETTIAFPANYIPVGETTIPFTFDPGQYTVFFELWTDDGGVTVYVNQIGYKSGVVATGTNITALDSLKIGTNTYTTGSGYSTVVTAGMGTGTNVGKLAVLRDTFVTMSTASNNVPGDNTTTNFFYVESADRIYPNSTFLFANTTTPYSVSSVAGTRVNAVEQFSTNFIRNNVSDRTVTFTTPGFAEQPTVLTLTERTVTTQTGVIGDLKGQVYVNSSTLYVAHEDYSTTPNNWLRVYGAGEVDSLIGGVNTDFSDTLSSPIALANGSTATTQLVTDDTAKLATTAFVHDILPKGIIMLWSGLIENIPIGWKLCDGENGTPNLTNRFVAGAYRDTTEQSQSGTFDGKVTDFGGGLNTDTAGTHDHGSKTGNTSVIIENTGWGTTGGYPGSITAGTLLVGSGASEYSETLESILASGGSKTTGSHDHTITQGGLHSHTYLPPYYMLAYIMKTSG
jgi:hypothetical protein